MKNTNLKRLFFCLAALMSVLTLSAQSIYDFKVKDDGGKEVSLSNYKGKVLLIVNTATRCGFTPQYKELETLYEKYAKDGFEILEMMDGMLRKHMNPSHRRGPYSSAAIGICASTSVF